MLQSHVRIIDVTADRLLQLPCCGITNIAHEGHVAKRSWLKRYLNKGLRARVLIGDDGRQCGYIEYAPGEYAWRAVNASGYMFINCVWTFYRKYQRQGHAKRLVRDCINDADKAGMRGVAVVARRKPWLAGSDLFLKCGFEVVDSAPPDFELLVFRIRGDEPLPRFRRISKPALRKWARGLIIIRSDQCPHTVKFAREISESAATEFGFDPNVVRITSARQARSAPTPYAAFSVIHNGRLLADHQISRTRFRSVMKKALSGQGHCDDLRPRRKRGSRR